MGGSYPGRVEREAVDLIDVPATREVVRRVLATAGHMDVLFNSAGVNLRGVFFVTQDEGRHMVAQL